MSTRVLEAQIIGGDHNRKVVFIPCIRLTASDHHAQVSFQYSHHQFPVWLAFTMSINKAQGQSVKYVGLDLQIPVFAHGQLYFACSRATSGKYLNF